MTKDNSDKPSSLDSLKSFSIRIGEHLHKRIAKHIQLLKHVKTRFHTKQKWIAEAFKEKIKNEPKLTSEDILREKFLHFKIDKQIYGEIEERVGIIKKFRNFSKKQWMLEAIYEQLEREEQETKNLLQNMIDSSSKIKK